MKYKNNDLPFLGIPKKNTMCICSHKVWEQTYMVVLILDV